MHRRIPLVLALLLSALSPTLSAPLPPTSPFFLHDGDTVVFYGDSITEQQMYARDIETFALARYPNLRVKFINSGWSGDTVWGGGGGSIGLRLQRDVLNYKPTVVTVFLGMNDGGYDTFDPKHMQDYGNALTHIIDEVQQKLPGVRMTLLTPSLFDYAAKDRPAPPADGKFNYNNPAPDYNQSLMRYGDLVKRIGAVKHIPVADLNAPMVYATAAGRRTDPKFALSGDGVHPNDVGHLVMAAAVLRTWHAAPLPAPGPRWPVPGGAKRAFALSPLVASLDPAALTTPDDHRSQKLLDLVQDRINQWHDFFKGPQGLAHSNDTPTEDELSQLRAENAKLDALRTQARTAALAGAH